MEPLRDEHIVCASCGVSFLFSGGEAAVFADRGLVAPKRCKECRRARKEQGGQQGGGFHGGQGGGGRQDGPRGGGRPSHFTGDVNEYRSPMQDRGYAAPAPPFARGQGDGRGPSRGYAPPVRDDGNYRAPSPAGRDTGSRWGRPAPAPWAGERAAAPQQAPWGGDRSAPPADTWGNAPQAPRPRRPRDAGPPFARPADSSGAPARPRDQEKFSITCNACGAQSEVPFRPADGRDVYCQACYRARKPG